MKNLMSQITAVVVITLLAINCRKTNPIPTPSETVNDAETVMSTITGLVIDENQEPAMNATVTLGTNTVTTNALGEFEFKNKAMSKNNAHIKVVKTGFFNGNRSMRTVAGGSHQTTIKLMPKTVIGTVGATTGGVVSLPTGGKVTFPANTFVDASGAAYTGTVNVYMAWLNPVSADLGQIMQGDLRGITTTGSERVLETYGMLNVEIESTAGQILKIATGKTAELRFPLPTAIRSAAPATIPLWYFSEGNGRWIEEGSAIKSGTEYIGNVKHFTPWNVDMPGVSLAPLTFAFTDNTGIPITNLDVKISTTLGGVTSFVGQSDNSGKIYPVVNNGTLYTLTVYDKCGTAIYTPDLGAFLNPSPGVIQRVTVPTTTNKFVISGTAYKCDASTPITNGSIKLISNGGFVFNIPVDVSGNYSFVGFGCGSPTNVMLEATDNTTGITGPPRMINFTTSSGTQTGVDLFACATTTTEFVSAVVKGRPYLWTAPTDDITKVYTIPSGYPNRADIKAKDLPTLALPTKYSLKSSFGFTSTVGTHPLGQSKFNNFTNGNFYDVINTASPSVNITKVDPAGPTGFISGNYSVNVQYMPANIPANVYCRFNVKRP